MDEPKISKINALGHPVGRKSETVVGGPSKTIQSHAKGLTVNEIMKRFASTGTIPDRGVPLQFLDTTITPTLFSALNMRVGLDSYFMGLDAVTRGKFENDPMKLVSFVNDPKNIQDGLDLGLLKLTSEGAKRKLIWDREQIRKKEANRAAYVADIRDILKSGDLPGSGSAVPEVK